MLKREILIAGGIDYDAGIQRFMNKKHLFERVLSSFLGDTTVTQGKRCLEAKDYNGLFESMHELKGVSGNLSITELFALTSSLVEDLRAGRYDFLESRFIQIETVCKNAKDAIVAAGGKVV